MTVSKPWDWKQGAAPLWLKPSEESYYIAELWKERGVKSVLDFGCGLGRHSVLFAKRGFDVSAFDLSAEGTEHLKAWAEEEKLNIAVLTADMLSLPYADGAFDALFAYHVISHTDSAGIKRIMAEIKRVLRPGGEIFITLCSKETWSYKDAGYPKLDENTVVKTDEGPEKGIPHFYVSLDDAIAILSGFKIEKIRHTDDCYYNGEKHNSRHYFITASRL